MIIQFTIGNFLSFKEQWWRAWSKNYNFSIQEKWIGRYNTLWGSAIRSEKKWLN